MLVGSEIFLSKVQESDWSWRKSPPWLHGTKCLPSPAANGVRDQKGISYIIFSRIWFTSALTAYRKTRVQQTRRRPVLMAIASGIDFIELKFFINYSCSTDYFAQIPKWSSTSSTMYTYDPVTSCNTNMLVVYSIAICFGQFSCWRGIFGMTLRFTFWGESVADFQWCHFGLRWRPGSSACFQNAVGKKPSELKTIVCSYKDDHTCIII